jgi:hypothetical protein
MNKSSYFFKEALHNPREDALVRIGIGHKALFAANSMAIGNKSNAVDCPSPGPRRPQGVMQMAWTSPPTPPLNA